MSSADMISPENSSRAVAWTPIRRGRIHVPAPVSGTRPRCTNTQPNRARGVAMRTSHIDVNSAPMPIAGPSMAHTIGFGHAISGDAARARRAPPPLRWSVGVSCRSDRSVPAQNAPGTPVRISARAPSSAAPSSRASHSSPSMAYVIAFFFSGRSIVIVPMPSRRRVGDETHAADGRRPPSCPSTGPIGPDGRTAGQIRRRSLAHAVSWWRLLSCSLRSTADTWVSIVFTDRCRRLAISL